MLVRELLSAGRSFDALLTLSDGVALGAVTELIRQGLRVPQDVAVIGFDDDLFANYCTVPLTSIHQPRNIGDDVMELLVAQIEREPGADYQPHPARLLKPHLVVRASTSA
jgi:DNA-binding LacI/PurR family transcriptional regulator